MDEVLNKPIFADNEINKIKAQYGKELSSKDGRKTKENEKNSSTSQKINNYRVVSQNESNCY